jgi:uncharacterized membrane protein SirB2
VTKYQFRIEPRLRTTLLWVSGVGLILTGPVGLWLIGEGAVHADRLLLAYWFCGLVWVASFTHWIFAPRGARL